MFRLTTTKEWQQESNDHTPGETNSIDEIPATILVEMRQRQPRDAQTRPRDVEEEPEKRPNLSLSDPKPYKNRAWKRPCEPRDNFEVPTSVHEAPRRRTREAREEPRGAREFPKAGQVVPKRAPDPFKIEPGGPPDEI